MKIVENHWENSMKNIRLFWPKKVIELGKSIKFYLDNTIPRPTTELELLLPPLAILERGLFLQRGPGPEEGELKWEIPARPK